MDLNFEKKGAMCKEDINRKGGRTRTFVLEVQNCDYICNPV
jgi:hypothetical protein